MGTPRGRLVPLTLGRRLVLELLHHARKIPSIPLVRQFSIPHLVPARNNLSKPISWVAIFMKAWGLVAEEIPQIRRLWMTFPYDRIYEHTCSECAVLVERDLDGEPTLLAYKIHAPEKTPLPRIDEHLRYARETPLWEVSSFRQLIRLGWLPGFLRRFFLWKALSVSGYRRACKIGTFMISSLGPFGVEQVHSQAPFTTYFSFGPIKENGTLNIRIVYDHRIMDGRTVGRALVRLEQILNTVILDELNTLQQAKAA